MSTQDTLRRFQGARFGAFIHFGLYSALARSEWALYNEAMPLDEYRKLADGFPAASVDPAEWVALAKRAGARYVVLTSRHHEGFCLWDSKTTDFTSVRTTGRDLAREFVDAARKAGLMVGFYYSLLDWSCAAYRNGPRADPAAWAAFRDKVHAQVRELLTGYGKIDILWYDGFWPIDNPPYVDDITVEDWRSAELNAMARSLQPDILINDRSGLPEDFGTPEQQVIAMGRPWEACMTTNDNWGWHAGDLNWKTPRQLIGALVQSVSSGGNFILNMGPRADGAIPAAAREGFEAVGRWLEANGESIYGCGIPPHLMRKALDGGFFCNSGVWTLGPDALYYHVIRWPGTSFGIRTQGIEVTSVRSLATGRSFDFRNRESSVFIYNLPAEPLDQYDTVLRIEYKRRDEK